MKIKIVSVGGTIDKVYFDQLSEYQVGFPNPRILITHGTDTMIETAQKLSAITDKCIVLTGAMEPARFKSSDAVFNVGVAVGAVSALPNGVYIAMNGRLFDPFKCRKNREKRMFEEV